MVRSWQILTLWVRAAHLSRSALIPLNHIRLALLHDGANLDGQIQVPPVPLVEVHHEQECAAGDDE